MSVDLSALQFFQNIRLDKPKETWIDRQLASNIAGFAATSEWPTDPSGCPLADIGNYLLRVLHILAAFAEGLLEEDAIATHIDYKMEELAAEDDLQAANFVDDKHAALRKITDQLRQASEGCRSTWAFTLSSPQSLVSSHTVHTISPSQSSASVYRTTSSETTTSDQTMVSQSGSNVYTSSYGLPSPGPAHAQTSTSQGLAFTPNAWSRTSFGSDNPSETNPIRNNNSTNPIHNNRERPSLNHLKSRGKGRYTCPHAQSCKKGGVQPNGDLTVFERNSAFRAHLQMHERLFKCDLPGCTNKKGFSRVDQLERHRLTVKHVDSSSIDNGRMEDGFVVSMG